MTIRSIVAALALVVAGCGGGGDSAAPAPPASPAQGFWSGTTSSGYGFLGAVLENGEYWFMYYANGYLYGVVQGTGAAANGNFTSSNGLDFYLGGAVTPVAVAGSYRERASLQGVVTPQAGGSPVTFAGVYDARYDTPATAAAASGVWRGRLTSGETYSITVATDGSLAGAGSSGCTFTGSVVPRPSGKAVYNVTVRFNGGVCLLGTQTIHGIAAIAGAGASAVLYAAALNAARSAGFVVIATR
jgi:hypothetical protein